MHRRRVSMRVGLEMIALHGIDEGVGKTCSINLNIRCQTLFLPPPEDENGSHGHCIEWQSADNVCVDQGNECLRAAQLRCNKHIDYAQASTQDHSHMRSFEAQMDPGERLKKEPVLCHGEIDSRIRKYPRVKRPES